MNIFETHSGIVDDYASYIRSFINIADHEIDKKVEESLSEGRLWPQPLLQFNPAYEMAGPVEDAIAAGVMHDDVRHIFKGYKLYRHQREAIELGTAGADFIVTSGTGSGKSLTYIGSVFDHLLARPQSEGVVAGVRDAYGWQDLDLEHDFHDVETLPENDRTRYTISPTARREVLKRLLKENHKRAAAEATNPTPKSTRSRKKPTPDTSGTLSLFPEES